MSNTTSDANATPITTPTAKSQVRSRKSRLGSRQSGRFWVAAITGTLIMVFLSGIVFVFGKVEGREFAPSHFEIRKFSFTEIPLLQLQITPIRRVSESSVLQNYLKTSSLIARPAGQPTDWHIVELNRFAGYKDQADAKLLTDFLNIPSIGYATRRRIVMQSDLYWHQWSTEHRQHAAVLWPEIQKLAQRELYLLIPEVFQIADAAVQDEPAFTNVAKAGTSIASATKNPPAPNPAVAGAQLGVTDPELTAQSVEAMRKRLREFLIASYSSLIDDMRAAGMNDVAESLRQEAAADYPDEARFRASK